MSLMMHLFCCLLLYAQLATSYTRFSTSRVFLNSRASTVSFQVRPVDAVIADEAVDYSGRERSEQNRELTTKPITAKTKTKTKAKTVDAIDNTLSSAPTQGDAHSAEAARLRWSRAHRCIQ